MNKEENISFIDIPKDIRSRYQYFTEANISKLQSIGFDQEFTNLEKGVEDYVKKYLQEQKYY